MHAPESATPKPTAPSEAPPATRPYLLERVDDAAIVSFTLMGSTR
jgi:hypothetical protein